MTDDRRYICNRRDVVQFSNICAGHVPYIFSVPESTMKNAFAVSFHNYSENHWDVR